MLANPVDVLGFNHLKKSFFFLFFLKEKFDIFGELDPKIELSKVHSHVCAVNMQLFSLETENRGTGPVWHCPMLTKSANQNQFMC